MNQVTRLERDAQFLWQKVPGERAAIAASASVVTEVEVVHALRHLPETSWLRPYVRYCAGRMPAHVSVHVLAGLTILASRIPEGIWVPWNERRLHGTLFSLAVGETGSGKADAMQIAERFMRVHAVPRIGNAPESEEALIEALGASTGQQQVLLFPKFGSFLQRSVKGQRMAPMRGMYAQAADGRNLHRRVLGKPMVAMNPRLSVMGCVSEAEIREYTGPLDWTAGFMGCFLIMLATPERPMPITARAPDSDPEWSRLADQLHKRVFDPKGEHAGFVPEAQAVWAEFEAWLETKRGACMMADAIPRAKQLALCVMVLLAWDLGRSTTDEFSEWHFGKEETACATELVKLHFRSVEHLSAKSTRTREAVDRDELLRRLTHDDQTQKQLLSAINEHRLGAGMGLRRFHDALCTLEAEGKVDRGRSGDGSTTFALAVPREPGVALSAEELMADADAPAGAPVERTVSAFPGTAPTLAQQADAARVTEPDRAVAPDHDACPVDGDDLGEPDHAAVGKPDASE